MKQILRHILYTIFPLIGVWGIVSCSDIDNHIGTEEISLAGTPINVSATAEEMEVSVESRAMISRAEEDNRTQINAEELSWLQGALEAGLDITYSDMTEETTVGGKTKEVRNKGNERVAILKYNQSTQKYSFLYKKKNSSDPDVDAKWNDNGLHYFEGQYVPAELRRTKGSTENNVPTNLISDQSNDEDRNYTTNEGKIGNYTLLSHYIGMPPSWKTSATVDFIRLPFKHRLCRVLAYVLIDESLNTTLRGYNTVRGEDGNISTKDDPNTTYFYFNHVKVLDHVEEDSKTVGHDENKIKISTLTPKWTEARRVTPHFYDEIKKSIKQNGEVVSTDNDANNYFIAYEDTKTGKKTYPRDGNWSSINNTYRNSVQVTGNDPMSDALVAKADSVSGYRRHAYKKVPIYDIIVRPTYNNTYDNVMYDEEGYYKGRTNEGNAEETADDDKIRNYYNEKNSIFFELELESGLQYSKTFTFDLNANQQTVVYLTIDRSGISYDESSYETWIRTNESDGYYGVDNGEDNITHNLSEVGSSWQRAIRNGNASKDVTDGNLYDDNVDALSTGRGQYMNPVEWTKEFAKAWARFGDDNKTPTKHGDRHGYYFMLDKDIEIDMRLIPDNFIFTGHLDGKGHKITLTNTDATVKYVTAEDESVINDLKKISYVTNSDDPTNIEDYTLPELYELFRIENLEDREEGEWVIPNLNVIESLEERGEGEWIITNLDALQGNENRDDGEWNDPNLNGVEGNEDRGDGGWTDSNVNGVEGNENRQDGWNSGISCASSQSRADGNNGGSTSKTYYLMVKVNSTEWANLNIAEINCTNDITKYYYKKTSTSFSKFKLDPHSVYLEKQVTANNYLFAGMNGMYVTAQETALGEHPTEDDLKNYKGVWEANVHAEPNKATNNRTQYNWVPYTGYRSEILNVEISDGYFFPTDTDITIGKGQTDKVNGYIINCKNKDGKFIQNIVDIPRYN